MDFSGKACFKCNSGLGNFGDDIERLKAAAAFLESFAKGVEA